MELCDFKKEIEKKFNCSALKEYKFNRIDSTALSLDLTSGQSMRACSQQTEQRRKKTGK